MATSDKVLGALMLLVAISVFTFYTTWALFLPFLPPDSPVHDLFPAREWAVRLPAGLLLLGISGIGLFFAKVIIGESRKKARAGKKA